MEGNSEAEKWRQVEELIDELNADRNRPEGRWGMHGISCVDDDYFIALDYVIAKLVAIRDA